MTHPTPLALRSAHARNLSWLRALACATALVPLAPLGLQAANAPAEGPAKAAVPQPVPGNLATPTPGVNASNSTSAEAPALDNSRSPFVGEPFFLLSDATFGSQETARVRLEINNPGQLETVGGVDVLVYRLPKPLEFLQSQRNLHRIQVNAQPLAGEGLAPVLTHLWDNWVVKARLAWQQLFSKEARGAVTSQAPALHTPRGLTQPSTFEEPRQFRAIPGLPVVERFRYPVQRARAIQPPQDLRLEGSSSEFIRPTEGNVFIPVGRRAPGLYLVEVMAGQHRATTLLFVSETVALTKVSGEQMLIWSAQREQGGAVPRTQVVWSDGMGVLKSGSTDANGLLRLAHKSPEQSYVFGQDPAGGVFISENFYYDSEIYNAKVYAVTDRPLYRPGDEVNLKISGREFRSARESVPLAEGEVTVQALDPAGQLVASQTLKLDAQRGAAGRFTLPRNAPAGGYELRMQLRGDAYTAAFRVADYQKPHFEIGFVPDKAEWLTGEPVQGRLQLSYPDGKPVAGARVSLTARAQQLAMIDGELEDGGAAALKLSQTELMTDASGQARFSLPAAEQPSRYLLSALATDGAAYRVRAAKEILIERDSGVWKLSGERQFSRPGESLAFNLSPGRSQTTAPARPSTWEWVRLEDRQRASGAMPAEGPLNLSFGQPGSYTLTLRDERRRIVAAASHWVSGDGLKAPAGQIGIVFNQARYQPGDTAEALLTFPEPTDSALLTLERDRVEAAALVSGGGGGGGEGFTVQRLGPTQWSVKLKVTEAMSPNIGFSVATVRHGDYLFQNQGISVEQPRINLAFKTEREVYAPGELVKVEVSATLAGQPVAQADLAVGVVDEMIYVLQPEIAPRIEDFFYHPRRNNVRTSATLSFIGYDLATRKLGQVPGARREVQQRALKLLERPRRDETDTAAWEPQLRTDASGRASFSFRMPDSLTRWRLTGRAMDAQGRVGQQLSWLRSDKPLYAKWTSPNWQREGDRALAAVAVFNQTRKTRSVEWALAGTAVSQRGNLTVQPGVNYLSLPVVASQAGPAELVFTLRADGQVADSLRTGYQRWPVAWRSPREQVLDLAGGPVALKLPADASNLRLTLAADPAAANFSRWMDELIDEPYGCVEQTASRMLPLSLALASLSAAQQPLAPTLVQRLATARLSLAQMAGPQARFGWWGRGMQEDAFLTTYAYYADWRAAQVLKLSLPDDHGQRLLTMYAKTGVALPVWPRALALNWMREMGLPVQSLQAALLEALVATKPAAAPASTSTAAARAASLAGTDGYVPQRASLMMAGSPAQPGVTGRDLALVLTAHGLAGRTTPAQQAEAQAAAARLEASPSPLVQSLLLLVRRGSADQARSLLAQVRGDLPTLDRAQALMWLHQVLGGRPDLKVSLAALAAPWLAQTSAGGDVQWSLPAQRPLPTSLSAGGGAKVAFLRYDSSELPQPGPGANAGANPAPVLPLRIERSLWKVVPELARAEAKKAGGEGDEQADPNAIDPARTRVRLVAVAPGTPLDSHALYLDQLSLTAERSLRFALLDVALPPGAAVESGTWGLDLPDARPAKPDAAQPPGGPGTRPIERAQHEPTAQGYAVPLEALAPGRTVVLRHLLRFSQRGEFKLPPARAYRMYDPEAKAQESASGWGQMEVR